MAQVYSSHRYPGLFQFKGRRSFCMTEHKELKQKMYEWTEKYANKAGYRLNPDKDALDYLLDGLVIKLEKFGMRYCPCRIVTGNKEEDRKIVCPCVYHKEEVEKDGNCHCELFFKVS